MPLISHRTEKLCQMSVVIALSVMAPESLRLSRDGQEHLSELLINQNTNMNEE